jgi:hypothetical protein
MRFVFTVEVELDRDAGPFASKDELADELIEAIEGADPSQVDIDESSYSVSDWSVSRDTEAEKPRKRVPA